MEIWSCTILLVWLFYTGSVNTASFYGDSFIGLPIQHDSDTTQLQLRFRTSLPNGLLLLAKGFEDYLSISLKDGQLQVQTDIGSGIITLKSVKNIDLHDRNWHQVRFQQKGLEFTLYIDNNEIVTEHAVGTLTQLNIEHIYLGGTPEDVYNPLGSSVGYFRGCILNVIYNQNNILARAHTSQTSDSHHHISWNCEDEFAADRSYEINFSSSTSYAAFPHLSFRTTGALTFEFKTDQDNALMLLNLADDSSHAVAVEIIDGKLKLTVNRGGQTTSLISINKVNNDMWHLVEIVFYDTRFVFKIDGFRFMDMFDPQSSIHFELDRNLFIGGALQQSIQKAEQAQIITSRASFVGCLRNLIIDNRAKGFPDIVRSDGLRVGCTLQGSCESNPCQPGLQCVEIEGGHKCMCSADDCSGVVEETPAHSTSNVDEGQSFVHVTPLSVDEGGKSVVTDRNINVVFDFKSLGIRESAIQFYVLEKPQFGTFRIDLGRRRNSDVFTLLDLNGNKVSYTHNGDEKFSDSVSIEMLIIGSDDIPGKLAQKYAFVLPIIITAVNDPPVIKIYETGEVKMAKLSTIDISTDILSANDPDSDPKNIVFTTKCETSSYFQLKSQPYVKIEKFSQVDVLNEVVQFVDKTGQVTVCDLFASDGQNRSENTVTLKFDPVKVIFLSQFVEKIALPSGSKRNITKDDISLQTNVPLQKLPIKYEVTSSPMYGYMEVLDAGGSWVRSNRFTQKNIDNNEVRYNHVTAAYRSTVDRFTFVTTCLGQRLQPETIMVEISVLVLHVDTPSLIRVDGSLGYFILSNDKLKASTNNVELPAQNIKFYLMRPPAQGFIHHLDSNTYSENMFDSLVPYKEGDTFTQRDIDAGLIAYKIKGVMFETLQDFADFRIDTPTAQSRMFRLRFEILPEKNNVKIVNSGLTGIYEGGQKAIRKSNLFIETFEFRDFEYTVTKYTQHGFMELIEPRSLAVLQRNISKFTNDDIRSSRLFYRHDDSERSTDSFEFHAAPLSDKPHTKEEEFSGTFNIQITMRNDNYPKISVNKVFEVVMNHERVLTLKDLAFEDPDVDYDPMNLIYSHRGASNGEFIFTGNKSVVYQFTQRDIADGNIAFRHKGRSTYGRALIWVTDGQFISTVTFEIKATNPYINIINNTGVFVDRGSSMLISPANLSVESNIDCQPDEFRFVLTREPSYGKVLKEGSDEAEFTFQDILDNKISYKHRGTGGSEDSFMFIVVARNAAQVQGEFPIRIMTASYDHPPKIVHNNLIEVNELDSVAITQEYLEVSHPNSQASSIMYTVTSLPKHGRLQLNEEAIVVHFTQQDINDEKLKYKNTESGPLDDFFTFDVTNGLKALRNIQFVMDIVPTYLEIDTQNLTVKEGGRVPLTPSHVKLKNRFYNNKVVDYTILQQPNNGLIETIRNRGVPISTFNSESVRNGEIFYVHDNSELVNDNFAIKAAVDKGQKESQPALLHVAVKPINDKPPVMVVNKKLEVWKGSKDTIITSDYLKAADVDSPPEKIQYSITQPTNGYVALQKNQYISISTFTQALINDGQVVFVHQGGRDGEFSFHVSDGLNSDGRLHKFYVSSKILHLSLVRNSLLRVYPGRTKAITRNYLYAQTNTTDLNNPIIINIMSKPKKGRIITRYNERPVELQSFKLDDIENNLIFYEHTAVDTEWDERDQFIFQISTLYAEPIQNQIFEIDVSYQNVPGEDDQSFSEKGHLSVIEGGQVILTRDHIDITDYIQRLHSLHRHANVSFLLITVPKHGLLLLQDRQLYLGQSFSQDDVNRRLVKYKHDDSETLKDYFSLRIRLVGNQNLDVILNFTVSITPVNDENFRLITTNPRLYVVQGMSTDITSSDLKTEDLDTPPDRIVYSLTILPRNGIIGYKDNPKRLINRFTQKDIDDGKIQFQHDGRSTSTTFHFSVSDGHFSPLSRSCYITVIPVSLELVENHHIQMMQTDTTIELTRQNVNIKTNGKRSNVYYNVTTSPRYGALYSGKAVVKSFKQTDIDDQLIYYVQHDLSSYVDYFMVDIFYPGVEPENVIHNRKISIGVEPLIVTNPFNVPIGERIAITTDYLDAGKLANVTGHIPQFKVIEKPRYGQLLGPKPKRTRRSTDSQTEYTNITYFSHEDILHGNVFYFISNNIPYQEGLQDSFGYMLFAQGSQPAAGRFSVKLSPPKGYTTPSVYDGGNTTDKNPKRSEVVEPGVRSDFVIILAILIPLFVLLIIVLLVVYFLWRHRRHREFDPPSHEKRMRPSISGPLALDQPHVHIEPQQVETPCSDDDVVFLEDHQNYYNLPPPRNDEYKQISRSDGKSDANAKIPQCKVTLLSDDNESTSRMSGYSVRSDTSTELFEWSSLMDPEILQHCRTSNPVLRDSQYWV